jgi:hypothetical protein
MQIRKIPVSATVLLGKLYFIVYGNIIITSQLEIYFSVFGALTTRFQIKVLEFNYVYIYVMWVS